MTKTEAIEILQPLRDMMVDQHGCPISDAVYALDWAIETLKQPERKIGQWVGTEFDGYADGNPVYYEWKCSNCGCIFEDEEPMYNFCPNCGARMEGK